MSKKITRLKNRETVSLPCKGCGKTVKDVDTNAIAATCWRCVCKMLNPASIILSDLTPEELKEALTRTS
jgi:hypothetical protein